MFRRIFLTRNLAAWDRALRALPALLALIAWSTGNLTGPFAVAIGAISALFLVTTVTGTCSIYGVMGWSTLRRGTK
jgi:Protein of unknown function (DUF2892)